MMLIALENQKILAEKCENGCNQHFLLFPQGLFMKGPFPPFSCSGEDLDLGLTLWVTTKF